MSNKYYAGIGSRETPKEVSLLFTKLATKLSKLDYILRSGGAQGADTAFQIGATKKEIYLPWIGFNGNKEGVITEDSDEVLEFVYKYHPAPDRLSPAALKLMSRNTYQVLGVDLKTPSEFIVCWTKDGKASGGTGQACRIAKDYNIPIFNWKNEKDKTLFVEYMNAKHHFS